MITGEVFPNENAEILVEAIKNDYSGEDINGITNPVVYVKPYKQAVVQAVDATVEYVSEMGQYLITIPAAYVPDSGTFDGVLKGDDIADVLFRIQVNSAVQDIWGYTERTLTNLDSSTLASNVNDIKANTDLLTLDNIYAQVNVALSGYNIPTTYDLNAAFTEIKGSGWTTETLQAIKAGQLTTSQVLSQVTTGLTNYGATTATNLATANSNILLIKNITDYLTLPQITAQCANAISDAAIPSAVWSADSRTLTSAGSSGATAQEVWEYSNRILTTAPATPTDVNSILSTYGPAKPSDVSVAIANAALATASTQNNIASDVSTIKGSTNLLTMNNIKAQCAGALNDAAIPVSVWTNTTRTLTSSGTGGGATATEIWSYSDRALTSVPTGTALASDLSAANTKLDSIKAKTDTIDWSMIKKSLMMEIGNYDIPEGSTDGTYTITLSGIGNASFTVDATGNRTLNSITVV
jgi:hypothetical protein